MPARDEPRWLGPYQLLTQVGEGGMGVVHLALDDQGRAVAVKVMRSHLVGDAVGRARLAREVASMRMVLGPHVAEVLDADVDCPTPFVVMRYVPGRPLPAVVGADGPLTGLSLHRFALGLARGLVSIHIAGVVHRDLKPGNVLVADGQPVVIDFGLAQLADDQRLTTTGLLVGTPGFLAPEILAGRSGAAPSDVHAWGATLAFAATGRPPYGTGPIDVILHRVLNRDIDLDGLPTWLEVLVDHATDLDPARRPRSQDLVTVLLDRVPTQSFGSGEGAPPGMASSGEPHRGSAHTIDLSRAGAAATRVLASPLSPLSPLSPGSPGSPGVAASRTRASTAVAGVGEHGGGRGGSVGPSSQVNARAAAQAAPTAPTTAAWPLAELLRPSRTGEPHPDTSLDSTAGPLTPTLRAQPLLGVLTVAAAAAIAAIAPVIVAVVGLALVILLRTVDDAARARARRAAVHGPRRSDAAVSVAVAPWQLARAALVTAALSPLAVAAVVLVLGAGAVVFGHGGTSDVVRLRWLDRSAGPAGRSTDLLLSASALAAAAVVTLGPRGHEVRTGYARVMARSASGGVRAVYAGLAVFSVVVAALLTQTAAPSLWPWRM